MLADFTDAREIAETQIALQTLVGLLKEAVHNGGFEVGSRLLKAAGRSPDERTTPTDRVLMVTISCPKHDFDVGLVQGRDGSYRVVIVGLVRYAGFSLSCALPTGNLVVSQRPDARFGVTPHAQRLALSLQSHP